MAAAGASDSVRRNFLEVAVGPGYVQTATQRFASKGAPQVIQDREHALFNSFSDGSDDDGELLPDGVPSGQVSVDNPWSGPEGFEVPLESRIPSMQYGRNNLTALSQKYNLYFASYGNRIFVYRPRDVPAQRLPQEPELILATTPDKVARTLGGYQDRKLFHQSNAIQIGSLGRREVLVLVYDDGSVFAFNVDDIATFVERKATIKDHPIPRPFLHENVGSSAWGIAIHQTSRLIAVSSNRFEVTVFAFGLTKPMRNQVPIVELAARSVAARERTCRIVLLLGTTGNNIPNISFWDDHDGLAEKVCAMDIRGNTWILDIWKPRTAPLKLGPTVQGNALARSTGWGVLVLPHTSFVTATDFGSALGFPDKTRWSEAPLSAGRIDITHSLLHVPDNPTRADRIPEWAGGGGGFAGLPHNVQVQILQGFPDHVPDLSDSESEVDDEDDEEDVGEEEGEDEDEDDYDEIPGNPLGHFPTDAAITAPNIDSAVAHPMPESATDSDSSLEDLEGEWIAPPTAMELHAASAAAMAFGVLAEVTNTAQNHEPPNPINPDILKANGPSGIPPYPPGLQAFGIAGKTGAHDPSMITPAFDAERPLRGDLVYFPSRGAIFVFPEATMPRLHFLRRRIELNLNETHQNVAGELLRPSSVLRTYVADIELYNSRSSIANVTCRNVAGMPSPDLGPIRRLHMLIHVPELSLVVAGSAIGRAVLLTPTRFRGKHEPPRAGDPSLKYGFRVERVLPLASDEAAAGRKSQLYGLAIGPVQEGSSAGSLLLRPPGSNRRTALGPGTKRYRLMMHFRDHSIMTFDLSRNGAGELNIT